jgi:anaerobic magnesium-protoporphyrin IX monomethyl ester cyclase
MTRILFGQSYYLRLDPKLHAAMQPFPPLGTLYAASYLRARDYDVGLFDAMLAGAEGEWGLALDRHRPAYAVIYEDNFNYLSKMCLLRMREAAWRMAVMAKSRGCTLIVCGADATDHCAEYLRKGADYVLIGEGEETLGELMDVLERRAPTHLARIAGLAWKTDSGEVRQNPRRPDLTDLDSLPLPAWDLVDIERYRSLWRKRHGYYSMNMVTTRGCPYHCNWCAKPIWGQRYNSRSPENVVDELATLRSQCQPDHIFFADDIFGLKPGWIEQFGDLVRSRGLSIPFKCLMRPDLVKLSTVQGLQRAGCELVWIGAESGSQKILDAMEKGTTVGQIESARRLLGAAGIRVAFFLQFGYPGESREDVDKTVSMVRDLAPDDIGISVAYPLPGTPFFERVRGQLGAKQNWRDSDDLAMLYQGPFPQEFYRVLHRALHAEFRTRRALRVLAGDHVGIRLPLAKRMRALAAVPGRWLEWRIQTRRLNRFSTGDHQQSAPEVLRG